MRIGFVSTAFPMCPENSVHGMYKRMGVFIDGLKEMGELDMLFYVEPDLAVSASFIRDMEERLAKHWDAQLRLDLCHMEPGRWPKGRWQYYVAPALTIRQHPPYSQTAQSQQVDAVRGLLSRNPDIVFVHRLAAMVPILLSKIRHNRLYFDLDDVEHVAFTRSIGQPPRWRGKPLQYLWLPILGLWEWRAIKASHTTFVCSENDRRYLSRIYGADNLSVIPNAITIPEEQEPKDEPTLLFLGRLNYSPNAVAADYLVNRIWPLILSGVPNARLLIAGDNPQNLASFGKNRPGVQFLGFVNDLEKLYRQIRVVCCPILSGGGTRIKILEAAAYGKPIVSTTIGAEGIGLRDGEEIFLRDDPRLFADTCIKLLRDRGLASMVGRAARSVIVQRYQREKVVSEIQMLLKSQRISNIAQPPEEVVQH